jgi:RNA polymerase sigma factor (sigma-70 family)
MKRRQHRSRPQEGGASPPDDPPREQESHPLSTPAAPGSENDDNTQRETQKALHNLPAHLRKILVLREIDRLPMEDVAARLGINRTEAERRWARAIELLTRRLAKRRPRRPRP